MRSIVRLSITTILFSSFLFSQLSDDAVRFTRGSGTGARPLGMGNAYIGIADDFNAAMWNPAGLAQMRRLELMGGLANTRQTDDATYFGVSKSSDVSATAIDNIGFVFPFPTVQGSFVVAFGYHRYADFGAMASFSGFNDRSSIIPSLRDASASFDIPYNVYLTNDSGYTTVQKDVHQSGINKESGSLGVWTFSGAVDIEENISLGISLNVFSGRYEKVRNFLEEDTRNIYGDTSPALPRDSAYHRFNKFYYDSYVNSELSGSNITIGLMYRSETFRLGAVVRGPLSMKVSEDYTNEGESVYDATGGWSPANKPPRTKHSYSVPNDSMGPNEYGVLAPWTVGIGASLYLMPELLLSADVEWTDWTQTEWTDNIYLERNNLKLQSQFRSVTVLRFGAELDVPNTDLRLRAGYAVEPSVYVNDPSTFDRKSMTAGAGYFLQRNVMLDAGISYSTRSTFTNQYSITGLTDPARLNESITGLLVNVGISYRF
ncbi:MAG: outer membrane protein transport protein [Bacteroidetes bacterium]|nr:outer membrane protein transport protein [Bacteroidota bacterium]